MTQQILIGIAALSGLLMLMPGDGEARKPLTSTPVVVICVALLAGLLARTVTPRDVCAFSSPMGAMRRRGSDRMKSSTSAKASASVAVSRTPNGVLNYHNAGKVQA